MYLRTPYRMQLSQPAGKILTKGQKLLAQCPEMTKFYKCFRKIASMKMFPMDTKNAIFTCHPKIFHQMEGNIPVNVATRWNNVFFSQKNTVRQNILWTHRMQLSNPAQKFSKKAKISWFNVRERKKLWKFFPNF